MSIRWSASARPCACSRSSAAAYNAGANWSDIALHLQQMSIVSFMSDIQAGAVMTENEQREELGLPPLDEQQNADQNGNDIN